MKTIWDKYNWILLAAAIIFTAGVSSATMTGLVERVNKLEAAFVLVPAQLARIEQKVDDLRGN